MLMSGEKLLVVVAALSVVGCGRGRSESVTPAAEAAPAAAPRLPDAAVPPQPPARSGAPMTTAVLRVTQLNTIGSQFSDAGLAAVRDGATELRVEIPAGVYERMGANLALPSPLKTLTVVGVGGPVVFRNGMLSFRAPHVVLRDLVSEGAGGSSTPVKVEGERIEIDGLAVVAASRRESGRRPYGEITLIAKGAATVSLKRVWIVGNRGGGTPGIGTRGGAADRFDTIDIADSVFAGNQTGHGLIIDSAANLRISNAVVLEPTLSSGWLELVDTKTRTEIVDSLLGVPVKLMSYWRSTDTTPDDFQRPVVRTSEFRGGGKGERIDAKDVTHGAAIKSVDLDALLAAARRLDTPDRAALAAAAH